MGLWANKKPKFESCFLTRNLQVPSPSTNYRSLLGNLQVLLQRLCPVRVALAMHRLHQQC